jgi:hypothetical protein
MMRYSPDTHACPAPDTQWIVDPKISRLIRWKALELTKLPGYNVSDRSDIEQELLLHLVKKSTCFDPTRAKATTFARQVIERKAVSLIRHVRAKKRCDFNCVSLNTTVEESEGREVELVHLLEEFAARRHTGQRRVGEAQLAQLRLDLEEANGSLSSDLRILAALLHFVTQFAAAEVLGISRREAARRVAQLRVFYEKRGLSA